MIARIISSALFAVWLVLVVIGKGGFVHLLLLSAICIAMVEIMSVYRSRLRA